MKIITCLVACVVLIFASANASAASYQADLERWISRDLTPYVIDQLTTQPRFKNEPIRFVVLADENPQSASSKLALSIRDRLRDSLAREAGVHIVWQGDVSLVDASSAIDCTKDQVNFYIGVEVVEDRGGLINVDVRALDILEKTWVAGFSKSWRGYLNNAQSRQLNQLEADRTFRGKRDAPFNESQFDLLAAHLAHELGCALLRQTAGEYVVTDSTEKPTDKAEAAMLELVSNNLADFRALRFSPAAGDANAVIEGKAHQIDDELYQYWVTITPSEANSNLAVISASAYIRIRDKYAVASLIPSVGVPIAKSDIGFLQPLKIVELRDAQSCAAGQTDFQSSRVFNGRYSSSAFDCYALTTESSNDSVLFFLNHQLNNGLVRLSGQSCNSRTDARIARTNEPLRFVLPADSLMSDSWSVGDSWKLNPVKDTYYVIAASDTKAARALSQHIRQLPNRCSAAVRNGLEGYELRRWMDQFAAIAEHWKHAVDWQLIRVKNIY